MLVAESDHASALACRYQLLLTMGLYKPCKNAMLKGLIQAGNVILTMVEHPILYSFRRCPYAMRARLALSVAGVTVRLREVALKHKPAALLQVSAKATVPVLVLADAEAIHESLDILLWALAQNDPAGWLSTDGQQVALMAALVAENDQAFKGHLDRYKYAGRDAIEEAHAARDQCEVFLFQLDERLRRAAYLFGERPSYVDMAILPFVRQFAHVDLAWFRTRPYNALILWLDGLLAGDLFAGIMTKYPPWQPQDPDTLWPSPLETDRRQAS